VLTLDETGGFVDVSRHGGPGRDAVTDLAANDSGNVYLTGFFESTATFDVGTKTVELTSNGGKDVFAARVARETVAESLLQVRLEATDLDENSISSIQVGSEFLIRAVVSDLRANAGGVFAAYLDLNYDPEQVSRGGAVTYGDAFPNSRHAHDSRAGLVDEAGAVARGDERLGPGEFVLFRVPFIANREGTAQFSGDPADLLPRNASLLFDRDDAVPAESIEYIPASITVVDAPANIPPQANDDRASTVEEVPVRIDVLENDADVDGTLDSNSVRIVVAPQHGTANVSWAMGQVTYVPDQGFTGADSFSYTVNDDQGAVSNAARVTIAVAAAPNLPPVAVDDSFVTDEDQVLVVPVPGVLGNDFDEDGDLLAVRLVHSSLHGTLSLKADGSFTYAPDSGFTGIDSFGYQALDGQAESNVATIAISVNPRPSIAVSPASLETNEAGGSAEFSVVLGSRPAANVTIGLSSSNAGEGLVAIDRLEFTPENWNEPQTVTVTAVDDDVDDGDVSYLIVTAPAVSTDPRYDRLDAADIEVTNRDDDTAGVRIVESSGTTTVSDGGGSDSYTVVLTSKPASDLMISLWPDNQLQTDPATLAFTGETWSIPQTITVVASDDILAEGTHSGLIAHTILSSDPQYSSVAIPDVEVEIADNDLARIILRANYLDDPNEGFFDPLLGAARRTAFEFALGIWSDLLVASYTGETITIDALMNPLGGNPTGAVLAGAGTTTIHRNFGGALSNTWYGAALANHLAGTDLNNAAEVSLVVNSDVDKSTVLGTSDWYYGTDAQPGDDIDFVSVVLHEVGHGLNFFDLIKPDGTYYAGNAPSIWERFLERGDETDLVNLSTAGRAQALTSNDLYWNGGNGIEGNAHLRPRIFAPTTYQAGSSVSHLDEAKHGSELMSPYYSGPDHEPSSLEQGMLLDMGWHVAGAEWVETDQLVISSPLLGSGALEHSEVLRNQSVGVYGFGTTDPVTSIDTVRSHLEAGSSDEPTAPASIVPPRVQQNPVNPLDVNNDGVVTPMDALLIVNDLNNGAEVLRTAASDSPATYLDANGDSRVTPLDALSVINFLNERQLASGEGESARALPLTSSAANPGTSGAEVHALAVESQTNESETLFPGECPRTRASLNEVACFTCPDEDWFVDRKFEELLHDIATEWRPD
jgi:hypothetical protein